MQGRRATVSEAGRQFARTLSVLAIDRTVQEVVDELIQTREKDGSNARHIEAGWTASLWMWVQIYWFRVVDRMLSGQFSCNALVKSFPG